MTTAMNTTTTTTAMTMTRERNFNHGWTGMDTDEYPETWGGREGEGRMLAVAGGRGEGAKNFIQ